MNRPLLPMDRLKRAVVGTPLGHVLERLRERRTIARASLSEVGCIANDLLAADLVVGLAARAAHFLDVGAHIGSVGARVLANSATTQVTFIEAIPDKADFLRRRYRRAAVHECAVGERTGRTAFFVDDKASGYSSLAEVASSRRIEVEMRRLDELVREADVIKIDIEGAELGALRGARELIAARQPVVMFESAPGAGERLGFPLDAMYAFWQDLGYSLWVPNRVAHDGPALTLAGYAESHLYPRRCTNYFAIAMDRREEVRDAARAVLGIGHTQTCRDSRSPNPSSS